MSIKKEGEFGSMILYSLQTHNDAKHTGFTGSHTGYMRIYIQTNTISTKGVKTEENDIE